jgi:Domain of unknown function (DUF4304)
MPSPGDLMRKALKKLLLPRLSQIGFSGKGNEFQRKRGDQLDLLSLQWGKYGGEFVIEFASRPVGLLRTSWGEDIPEVNITTAHVHPLDRARLLPADESAGLQLHGFQFANFEDDLSKYESLAQDVASLLTQVDSWLVGKVKGANVRPLNNAA